MIKKKNYKCITIQVDLEQDNQITKLSELMRCSKGSVGRKAFDLYIRSNYQLLEGLTPEQEIEIRKRFNNPPRKIDIDFKSTI